MKFEFLIAIEINDCHEKSKDLNTGCDFIKCFHERYHCNDESVTAWAYELCRQFPQEVILQFTPEVKIFDNHFVNYILFNQGRQMMINIQNCTQDLLARIFRQRKTLNCTAFESKYFSNLAKCYSNENTFCQVFKDNRAIFMKQATTVMLKKPR